MKTTFSSFQSKASFPIHAIVLLFDLEGFSKFFSQPDVHEYVPKYLNLIIESIETCFKGGTAYWILNKNGNPQKYTPLAYPIHSKFLGDGALYILNHNDFGDDKIITLLNRLWNLKNNFEHVYKKSIDIVPVVDIPKQIRIGVSAGTVYKLTYQDSKKEEYIGYCINLISRLQSYCREINFVVSGRLNLHQAEIEKNSYIKVVATKLAGFPKEIVLLDKNELKEKISEEKRLELFSEM